MGSGHERDTHSFSPPRGPLRFDLDNPFRPRRIVNETTPFPILWPLHQFSLYRIAMDVPQPLDAFRFALYGKIVIDRSLYFSPMRFFPSIMTLLKIRLIRVW